jgi:hypothetical protein
VYYGGTSYANKQGLGVQLPLMSLNGEGIPLVQKKELIKPAENELAVFPVNRLYDLGITVTTSPLLTPRLASAEVRIHPSTAKRFMLTEGMRVMLPINGAAYTVQIVLDDEVPEGVGLIPRSVGIPIYEPEITTIAAPVSDHSSGAR